MPWAPIADAPRDGTLIDVWFNGPRHKDGGGRVPDCWYDPDGNLMYDYGRDGPGKAGIYVDDEPTHFMLPPEGPEIPQPVIRTSDPAA